MIKDGTKSANATTTNPPGKVRNNQLFRVSRSSPLYSFLASKNAILPGGVTVLGLVLSLTKSLIKTGKHYDEKNPSIILCSQQLENVFGMKALHVKQVMPALYKAMVPLNDEEDVSEDALVIDEDVVSSDEIAPTSCPPTTSKSANEEPKSANVDEPKYTMSVELAQLLLPNQANRAVSFKEAAALLSKYIIQRKDHLFDVRNIMVALVENDLLGKVFGVKAFHRSQTAWFIKQQLRPVVEGSEEQQQQELAALSQVAQKPEPRDSSTAVTSLKRCSEYMDDSELPVKKRTMRQIR